MSYSDTIDIVSSIFGRAVVDVLHANTQEDVEFIPTVQKIPNVRLKPDICCFVQFSGDYSGLIATNFSKDAAMQYYRTSMLYLGMPESELARDYTSEDVVNYIGEAVNQLIGKARALIQDQYGLSTRNNQPKAICLLDALSMSIEGTDRHESQCRRLSFKLSEKYPFGLELFLEPTEFMPLSQELLASP